MKENKKFSLKPILFLLIFFIVILLIVGTLFSGKIIKYGRNELVKNYDKDGPYLFYKNPDTLSINYIKRNKDKSYSVNTQYIRADSNFLIDCFYSLDSTKFEVPFISQIEIPNSIYNDENEIFAVSDIESNYKTFRNFLINNEIIDKNLKWIFGKGHLVLVGDFIDRSYFATQVLWFIYKLEKEAKAKGGTVHFILGNHEIMNMQGDHRYAKSKYEKIAELLSKNQAELYDTLSYIGRWMNSKNIVEKINGNIFTHAGFHPDITNKNLTLSGINRIARVNRYKTKIWRKREATDIEKFILSSKTSPYWYRGYFKEPLKQSEIEKILAKYGAKTITVGHTIQLEITTLYNGKIIAIDVHHPKDYYKYFPVQKSEGLFIKDNNYYRVLNNGTKEKLND